MRQTVAQTPVLRSGNPSGSLRRRRVIQGRPQRVPDKVPLITPADGMSRPRYQMESAVRRRGVPEELHNICLCGNTVELATKQNERRRGLPEIQNRQLGVYVEVGACGQWARVNMLTIKAIRRIRPPGSSRPIRNSR